MRASQSRRVVSPVPVSSTVTAWMEPSPWISRTSAGAQMRTLPSPSSLRASFTEVSSARKRSRRWMSVIGRSAVSCKPSVQSRAESPPPTITQFLPLKTSLRVTK